MTDIHVGPGGGVDDRAGTLNASLETGVHTPETPGADEWMRAAEAGPDFAICVVDGQRRVRLSGLELRTLRLLMAAGPRGIAAYDVRRWTGSSVHVCRLRRHGIVIDTMLERERRHFGRYFLVSRVEFVNA